MILRFIIRVIPVAKGGPPYLLEYNQLGNIFENSDSAEDINELQKIVSAIISDWAFTHPEQSNQEESRKSRYAFLFILQFEMNNGKCKVLTSSVNNIQTDDSFDSSLMRQQTCKREELFENKQRYYIFLD